jgi:carbonic anhydrase
MDTTNPVIDPLRTVSSVNSLLSVAVPKGSAGRSAARNLFLAQLAWVESLGLDLGAHDSDHAIEYADPVEYYRKRGTLLMASLGRTPVGIVSLRSIGDRRAELRRLFVQPWARGHAAGPALLSAAIAVAPELGARRIVLETLPGAMDTAIALYRRFGFVDTDPFHVDHPGVIALALEL